jgi:hypothetical protein
MKKNEVILLILLALMLTMFPACKKYYNTDSSDSDQTDDSTGSEEADDYTWDDSEIIEIVLNGSSITENSDKVTVDGSKATVISAGTYRITGTLSDGQILVDTKDAGIVRLILNGVNITCSNSAPIYIKNAGKALIVLATATNNFITDGTSYILDADEEPKAAVFSKSYLSFFGGGSLSVDANYKDGISGKDGLLIKSGTFNINAADDGIRGKDYLIIKDGNISVSAAGDGFKSDNEEDAALGYVTIESANVNITAGGDGISSQTDLNITDGSFKIITGGGTGAIAVTKAGEEGPNPGNQGGYNGTISEKALKSAASISIAKGSFVLDAADDAIHATNSVALKGGSFTIATGDDAIHAETSIAIAVDTLNILKSYESLESASITVTSGFISMVSSDDGFNATKGSATEANDGSLLTISGGTIVVNSSGGDGIDSNGNVVMTGGTVVVHGPQSQPEVGIDVNGTFNVSGGLLLATGPNSGNMIEANSSSSSQYSAKITISSTLSSSSLFHIQDAAGKDLVTYKPVRTIYYVVFSSPDLQSGSTYSVYTGGSYSGTSTGGIYTGGSYSGGTLKKSFVISAKVTNVSL